MALNLNQARFNMIEQQVRTWDVLDARVLDVLREVPREDFVPPRYRKLAFADLRLPLGHGQVMMKPVEEGRMLQALDILPGQHVLEVGTGSGFVAACLARLGATVTSLEIVSELADAASARLQRLGQGNVTVITADALGELNLDHRFATVVVTGSCAELPHALMALVEPGGRLFGVRGYAPAMEAVCMRQLGPGRWLPESLFETDLPRLLGAEDQPKFEF